MIRKVKFFLVIFTFTDLGDSLSIGQLFQYRLFKNQNQSQVTFIRSRISRIFSRTFHFRSISLFRDQDQVIFYFWGAHFCFRRSPFKFIRLPHFFLIQADQGNHSKISIKIVAHFYFIAFILSHFSINIRYFKNLKNPHTLLHPHSTTLYNKNI